MPTAIEDLQLVHALLGLMRVDCLPDCGRPVLLEHVRVVIEENRVAVVLGGAAVFIADRCGILLRIAGMVKMANT